MEYSKLPYVLYKSDFDRMHCCVHFETKNDSAVRIARVLKQMGVEFWYMPLTLKDPSLRNVNPFDPNLSDITKAKIAIECKYNFWYFFRECLQLPLSGGMISPFIFSRANLGTIWTFFNDIDLGLVIPRQCGKSFCTQVLICYMMYVLADNAHMAHIDKSSTNSMNVVKVLKDIRDAMPKWLWQPTTADVENKESISYAKKSNLYSTFAAAIDKVAAGNIARGLSLTVVHFDEIAYIRYNWLTVPAAQAAKLKAAPMARKQGLPCPTMYTTTAGNPDTETGAYALGIFEDAMPFTEKFYDLHDHDQFIETVDQNAHKRRVYLEFSYQQLGMTDEWFKQASEELNGNPDDIARDLLNIWQASSAENVIPQSITQILRHSKQEPAFTDLSHGFLMRWYLDESIVKSEEFKNRPLVAGMDTSENIGRDWTTLVIMDPRDLNVIATCRCNNANTMQVANYIADLLLEFKGMVWIPERNNTGIAIIDFVLAKLHDNRINPYKRIYNEVIQQRDDPKFAKIDIAGGNEIVGKDRSYFGYRTKGSGSTSRDRLYKDVMMHCLELAANKVKDSTLINEYCNLTVRNGRVDHREGLHDDLVFGHMMSAYLILQGKNLSFYGISPREVLSTLRSDGSETTAEAKDAQMAIRKRISELEYQLSNPRIAYILRQSYQRELANLRPLVDDKIMESVPLAATQVDDDRREMKSLGVSDGQRLKVFGNQMKQYWQNKNSQPYGWVNRNVVQAAKQFYGN